MDSEECTVLDRVLTVLPLQFLGFIRIIIFFAYLCFFARSKRKQKKSESLSQELHLASKDKILHFLIEIRLRVLEQ